MLKDKRGYDVCEGGLKKDMKMKKEFKLKVHEAHDYKLKFQLVSP